VEKAYRKKVGNYDRLRADLKRRYPKQEVEQATIVVGATGVFHKRSQVEFAKATRLGKKDLARWQMNDVDMALNGSYQLSHESMEKIKFNLEHPPAKEVIEELEKHESDLIPDATPVVVPYLIYKDQRRAVEILPDTPEDMLEMIIAALWDNRRKSS
jgi:hypothetical protein